MPTPVQDLGFTILQDPTEPELDIVFVHGLQGHPRKTWTFNNEAAEAKHSRKRRTMMSSLRRKSPTPTTSPDPEADPITTDVFWPEDLLSSQESCQQARIMTYGYDSVIFKLLNGANFSTITSEGISLLNALTRRRVNCRYRPLMFITHSLGGLIVKSALNESFLRASEAVADLRAIVDSTFAIIFFGTPHRGSSTAEFGQTVAEVISHLTMTRYNANILSNLRQNTEILTKLRSDFESSLTHMVQRNRFESTTFQENRAISGIKGLSVKVVTDDSSELGQHDRKDHIEKDHVNMCKFSGADDQDYDKVGGEIDRHISRLRQGTDEKGASFMKSLQLLGNDAKSRLDQIQERDNKTLEWLYTASIHKGEGTDRMDPDFHSLGTWLAHGSGLFWVTGRPGSGKSTLMKHLLRYHETMRYLNGVSLTETIQNLGRSPSGKVQYSPETNPRLIIGLFITSFGKDTQRRWSTMLQGALLQLLKFRPELVKRVLSFLEEIGHSWEDVASSTGTTLGEDTLKDVLLFCKESSMRPFQVLIILDGLDELDEDEHARNAVDFLKKLSVSDDTDLSRNSFRVCISSRPEQTFRDLFFDLPRIEVQDHTQHDIRLHVQSLLGTNPCFRNQTLKETNERLQDIVDYISSNANGVFLWAHSISKMVDRDLRNGKEMRVIFQRLRQLPTEMKELYQFIMNEIDAENRQRVYIMLEVVLRAQSPVTLLELALIVHTVEDFLNDRRTQLSAYVQTSNQLFNSFFDPKEFLDSSRLERQLHDSCRCMLEICHARQEEAGFFHSSPLAGRHPSLPFGPLHGALIGERQIERLGGEEHSREVFTRAQDSGRHDEVELLNQSQFTDYHGKKEIDPSRHIVRLFHKSAKEFLLDPDCLNMLFKDDSSQKPPGNGHAFNLIFAKKWINCPRSVQKQLRCHFDLNKNILFHVPLLEKTMNPAEVAIFFPLLDEIDSEASKKSRHGQYWAQSLFETHIDHWKYNFPAFTVASNMLGYVNHRLSKSKAIGCADDLLNGKAGRPLLHFSAFHGTPSPEMTRLLINSGANIEAKFEKKTAIESLILKRDSCDGGPSLGVMKVLLENGASPNSRYYSSGNTEEAWFPLIHIITWDYALGVEAKLSFLNLLLSRQADPNGRNWEGMTFIEVLYWYGKPLPQDQWLRLFKMGGRITKNMICNPVLSTQESCNGRTSFDSRSTTSFWSDINIRSLGHRSWGNLAQSSNFGYCSYQEIDTIRPGLCDQSNDGHDAYRVLRQRKFRVKEWYKKDARKEAKRRSPHWFSEFSRFD